MTEYLTAKDVKASLANTPQITFEVTDACNLNCTYCGYGKFYSDYDARENKKMPHRQAILFLKYLKQLWESPLNRSYQKNVYIGFYGGEPLLNMNFIKEVVRYINYEIKCATRTFTFSMTTNAILLHKYMDFLAENNFSLLISLDGDEYNTSYRVDHAGNPSFCRIIDNVNVLRNKYPGYFDRRVNFNAVLHNRNSVESIYRFIKETYDKIPSIGELNDMGIRPEMKKEFKNTYRNSYESLHQSEHYEEIEKDMFIQSGTYQSVSTYLLQHSEFVYKDYNELLFGKRRNYSIPTGTCIPFGKKVYITVNGRILPCERIGHQFALGQLTNQDVAIDFESIACKYNDYYRKVDKQCKSCYTRDTCIQCIFNLPDIDKDKVTCHGFTSKKNFVDVNK
jgi:uncharacterized protein